eukprot:TRINITY_DN7030_c0_g1_i5.p1 TRINITY_DN7030_c0_g1~~TRINITY_DN7030_c0_g1_i5.p1  ORF type:complete len:451 (+),score=63.57 TRINITY_DN7030_c0_g1_i5:1226-2578(+)
MTAGQLIVMMYFWTSGGPFGIESAVGAGGALLTLVGIGCVCFFWALPQALMSAELSLMINVNGGNVIWVQRAFGDFIGFINAQCNMAQNLSSQALLVVLFVQYIPIDLTLAEEWSLRTAFVVICVVVNIWGVSWLSRISWFLLVFVFLPFIGQMVMIVVDRIPINYDALIAIPPLQTVHWGVLVSTVVWAFGGFDSMGSVAGEVKGGKSTFLLGLLGSFPLTLFNYMLPIFVNYIVDSNNNDWVPGYFTIIVYNFFPSAYWLGVWVTIASAVANFGQLAGGIAPVARIIWAMAKGREGGIGEHRYLPYFLSWSWQRHTGTIRPIAAIFANGIVMLAVSALPFTFLIQLYLLVRICNILLEYAALIALRVREPDTPRPFVVPFGIPGCVLLTLPTIAISGLAIWFSDKEVLITGAGTLGAIIVSYPIKVLWKKLTYNFFHKNQKQLIVNTK